MRKAALVMFLTVVACPTVTSAQENEFGIRAFFADVLDHMSEDNKAALSSMLTLYNQDCAPIGPTATSVASKLAGFAGRDRMIAANRLIDGNMQRDRAAAWCANFKPTIDVIQAAGRP